MQSQVIGRLPRMWAMLGGVCVLAVVAGCPGVDPVPNGNTNDNTNDNGQPSPVRVDVTIVGQGDVDQSADGNVVTLTAVPAAGWAFDSWTGVDLPDDVDPTAITIEVPVPDATDPPGVGVVFVLADTDGDGVPDVDDQCADTPASEEADANGCGPSQRDSDGDGVNDDIDECPRTNPEREVDEVGCPIGDPGAPDADGDGVGDDIDECPDTPEGAAVDANGCADSQLDTDDDGVTEDLDQCPDTPAGAAVNDVGCPDTDGDGVFDNRDRCPNTPPGTNVDSQGCAVSPPPPPDTCGDNTLDAGEECDGTADAACPGQCQANCTCAAVLANDDCGDALAVTDGDTTFTTAGATTDGPDEPGICTFFGESHIESDVWFCYTATCTGTATATLCGSQYDTKMAVYNGCSCPPAGDPIVCSDDDCGVAFTSRTQFTVVTGQQYMIRVGGFQGEQGEGLLTVGCDLDPCAEATGACFDAHGGKGCEDETCCNTTCDVDPFCCDVEWDEFCAAEAEGLCTGSFSACAAGAGSCASDNATPGCDDVECCNQVCMDDPFCCVDTWDELCAEAALATCFLTCGGQSGSCFATEGNGTPGCEDVSCCEAVCAIDPLCCTTEWDDICAETAATECR